jgi:hypothetical protein
MSQQYFPNLDNATTYDDYLEAGRSVRIFEAGVCDKDRDRPWEAIDLVRYRSDLMIWLEGRCDNHKMTRLQFNTFMRGWQEDNARTLAEANERLSPAEQAKKSQQSSVSQQYFPNLDNATTDDEYREAGRSAYMFLCRHSWGSTCEWRKYRTDLMSWVGDRRDNYQMTMDQYFAFMRGWEDGIAQEGARTRAEAEERLRQAKKAEQPTVSDAILGFLCVAAIAAALVWGCQALGPDKSKWTDKERERFSRETDDQLQMWDEYVPP